MSKECRDRDLLLVEPILFLGVGYAATPLAGAADGRIANGKFISATAHFLTAGVEAGMVLCVWTTTASEGAAYEIVAVDSATQLAVSLLRADTDVPPLAPPDQTGLSFRIQTYRGQIRGTDLTLAEKLRRVSQAAGLNFIEYVDSCQLRQTIVYGTLAEIFASRSNSPAAGEANWIKADYYRQLFREAQIQLRLAVDADGDGTAEQTRSLGNVTLRRV